MAGVFYIAAGPGRRRGGGAAGGVPEGTGAGGGRPGAAGHHRRRAGQALDDPRHRDAAAITFLVTLSGVTLAGIGAAFWGVVAGVVALAVQQRLRRWRRRLAAGCSDRPGEPAMQLLFVADPLDTFKTYKDSTFAMMREAAAARPHAVACEPAGRLRWQRGGRSPRTVRAASRSPATPHDWFRAVQRDSADLPLAEVDAVLMRKDPPFDSEYFYATHLLSQAEREGARVFNKPAALRDHPEKLAILEFPQFIGPTLVTRDAADVRAFHAEHRDIILKPLDGMGGMGIFRVGPDGLNLGSIIETLNRDGAQTLMVQRTCPRSCRATSASW
jgi:hypothetical protein